MHGRDEGLIHQFSDGCLSEQSKLIEDNPNEISPFSNKLDTSINVKHSGEFKRD